MIRIGCSGWNYASWRGDFYPHGMSPSRWLEHYASAFDTVEVNSTFYRLARHDAVARWVRQTPEHFCFAVKSSRYLTHVKRLQDMGQGVQRLYEPLQPLVAAGRLGPVLWQLPANFHRDEDRLARALAQLPPGRHTFEFRHASWFSPEVLALLRRHGVALTIADRPELTFQTDDITSDFVFVRFHYGHRGRRQLLRLRAFGVGGAARGLGARRPRRLCLLQQRLGGVRAAQRAQAAADGAASAGRRANYVTAPSEALETSLAYLPRTPPSVLLSGPS